MDEQVFRVELSEDGPGARLRGELDLAAYDVAAAALEPLFRPGGDVTLDLSELTFVDSSGIRLLIRLRQAIGDDGRLVLRSPQPHVARVLGVAGLEQLGVRIEASG